jgi:NAD(P)-dependent dehydrogenase (short-subunit alcohol dehydrogenase family)
MIENRFNMLHGSHAVDSQRSNFMNKIALVTGASRGLGKTIATFLAGRGDDLIITARGAAGLAAVAQDLEAYGGRVIALPGDVSDLAHVRRLVAAAHELGRLDLLVNNASILGPSPQPPLADYPLETLEQVFAVNVLAPLGLIQAALPLLKAAHGSVINISSDAAVGGYPGWGGYGASKAALDLISLTLANELRDEGVAAVAVDPGDMRTQMHQEAFPGEDISDRPVPEVTLPFWAWLLGQNLQSVSGRRFQAQAEVWLAA